jgi:sec-independent protein translocase protein TatB
MLEVGWSEILVIALILIIVVGPKDLPGMLRTFGRMASRVRGMANEFKGQFDQALREAELDDVRKGLSEVNKINPANSLRDAINPIRQLSQDIKADLKKASDMVSAPVAAEGGETPAVEGAEEKPAESVAAPVSQPVAAEPAKTVVADKPVVAEKPVTADKPVEAAPQPIVAAPAEAQPAKPKATRKKAAAPATVSDAAVNPPVAEEKSLVKKPVGKKQAAAAAVAAEAAVLEAAAKPKKSAPRKKAEKAGDA